MKGTDLGQPLVFLDIETTGGSPRYSRITEIGALRVESGRVVATFQELVNPEEHVPAFITRLTGIHDEMLWDAPLFSGIKDELELFLSDAVFVAHNVNFDYSFIRAEFAKLGQSFSMDHFCTARLSRKLYPHQPRHNLDTVIMAHNIKMARRHRAFDDAKALFSFYKSAVKDHGEVVNQAINSLLISA